LFPPVAPWHRPLPLPEPAPVGDTIIGDTFIADTFIADTIVLVKQDSRCRFNGVALPRACASIIGCFVSIVAANEKVIPPRASFSRP